MEILYFHFKMTLTISLLTVSEMQSLANSLSSNVLGFQGRLQNIRELDFESRTSFSLTIVIMDRGQQSRSIEHSVIVNISDVNDCIPDFGFATSSRFTRIDEELPNGRYSHCIEMSLLL